jgi:hypothetical protein
MIRLYRLYKLLGQRVGNLGFLSFSWQYGNRQFASQLPSYVDWYDSLPEDLAAQASIVHREYTRVNVVIVCWFMFILILLFVRL